MIEVRIRHQDDAKAHRIGEVPFDALDTVIPTIQRWGINGDTPDLIGQFFYDERAAYFEVVICEDED